MLKSKYLLNSLIFLSCLSLFSCTSKNSDKVVISEYYYGSTYLDSALEITNKGEKEEDLSNFKINIYDLNNVEYSYTLSGLLNIDSSLVIANKSFVNEYNINNIVYLDDDYLTGNKYIELVNTNNSSIDSLGNKGYNISFVKNQSLVRLKEYYIKDKVYNVLHYVKIEANNKSFLGNSDCPISEVELLNGPKLTEEYSSLSFTNEKEQALGGYVEVTIVSLGDGDTTVFNYPSSSNLVNSSERTRYLMINTPEVDHGSGSSIVEEKWGKTAQIFNNDILNSAKHILVQSNKGYSLRETYGRLLGYVWYTTKEDPSINDYILLNHQILINGLAKFDSHNVYENMKYKNVYYYSYFEYGYEYASKNQLKIYGNEDDPNFN